VSAEGRTPEPRPPWRRFREALDAAGFRPSKARGQNFLVDGNMARAIAQDAGVGPGDRVLEVGPGCAFLSVQLAALGVELLAVEIDPVLAAVAREELAPFGNVELLEGDVLAGKNALSPAVVRRLERGVGPWHLVANLPYSISGPLLVLLSRLERAPESVTVLIQDEVVERIVARPGESEWSALSAKLAARYDARRGRAVGAQLFWPRPRVESAVCHLRLRPGGAGPRDLVPFDRVVDALFQQRRKKLVSGLARLAGGVAAARGLCLGAGVDPELRPEALDLEALFALARALAQGRDEAPPGP